MASDIDTNFYTQGAGTSTQPSDWISQWLGTFPSQASLTTASTPASYPSTTEGTEIPYGTYTWSGAPDYITNAVSPVFSTGPNTPSGVWGWVQGLQNAWAGGAGDQGAVDTTNLQGLADKFSSGEMENQFASAAQAQQRAQLRDLEQTVFKPVINKVADTTGFLNSTTMSQALRGAMSDLGKQALNNYMQIAQQKAQMQQQNLTQAGTQYKNIADYQRDQYLRALQALQYQTTGATGIANALTQLIYSMRRNEQPLDPYATMLAFAK